MNSRESILEEIKNNKPAQLPLPVIDFFENSDGNLKEKFANTLTSIGGVCISVENNEALKNLIELKIAEGASTVQTISNLPGYNAEAYFEADATALQHVKTVYIQGTFGVAENGSLLGVIYLKDVVKPNIKQRFHQFDRHSIARTDTTSRHFR